MVRCLTQKMNMDHWLLALTIRAAYQAKGQWLKAKSRYRIKNHIFVCFFR